MRIAMFALAVTTACGSSGGDPEANGSLPDAPPGFVETIAPRVVGSYAMRQQIGQIRNLPIAGEQAALVRSVGVATIRRELDGFVLDENGCRILSETSGNVTTTIDDAVPRSVPVVTSPLEIAPDGDDVVWRRAEVAVVVGARLPTPNEALPSSASDPRVWDQDGDGQPGVTAHVSGLATGNVYVVQRQRASYDGLLVGDGHLTGHLADRSEQSVIGASNPLLNQNIATTPDPDPAKSTIELVRTAEPWTCDRLIQELGSVFP